MLQVYFAGAWHDTPYTANMTSQDVTKSFNFTYENATADMTSFRLYAYVWDFHDKDYTVGSSKIGRASCRERV